MGFAARAGCVVRDETFSGALQRSLDKITAKKARSRAAMAAAFAAIEAQNAAARLTSDPHAQKIEEWARKHRTQLEASQPASERDPLTLSLFD